VDDEYGVDDEFIADENGVDENGVDDEFIAEEYGVDE
tara:strand:- start:5 stop:115 length:111 start_codon:yes stop_codon:yes gene_type:complete